MYSKPSQRALIDANFYPLPLGSSNNGGWHPSGILGVITVLGGATNRLEERQIETNYDELN
jgi:hypothetical protein